MCDKNHQDTIEPVEHEQLDRSEGVLTISQDQWGRTALKRRRERKRIGK